jgi:hypothetical protein
MADVAYNAAARGPSKPTANSADWRIIWRFEGTGAIDVDLIDYH